jgi:hypothetical protein
MDNGCSPGDPPSPAPTGRLSEDERHVMRARAAQARAATAEAIAHYTVLLTRTRSRLATTERTLVETEAIREMVRQSVERYAALMKALDTPPEHVLRVLKQTVAEELPHPEREEATLELTANVVTWCIEAYYSGSSAA